MGTRIVLHTVTGLFISFILTSHLINVTQGSKVWGEVAFPEDLEAERAGALYPAQTDDEDFAADEASGDLPSGDEDGSTPEPKIVGEGGVTSTMYYRALVNFTDSFVYSPELENIYSDAFREISDAVVDTLESEYNRISGVQTVNVVIIRKIGRNVFVELDVVSDYNSNDDQILNVLYSVVKEGSIASYVTSVQGFEFRRLGEVVPSTRPCLQNEFTCHDGGCIPREYYCDKRPDCMDMSDELACETLEPIPTPARPLPDREPPRQPVGGPCKAGQATCQNGECIPRDYLCDGERDCTDGSDEIKCGTPSPCEPNEFKCQNGRCALKLWRCDGDNDCGDNSDESYCPTKGPGDTCAPEQFMCVVDRTCIPASYQCDEESDCADRSDEYDCSPPSVTSPPEESVKAQRGQTVTFTCTAVGVPTPIITWRLNWGHIPTSSRITVTSENGRGTLTIRDVKEGDQGAYTCEAINAKGMVFAVPDGVLTLTPNTDCPSGHFSVDGSSRCIPCFCFGITKNCQNTGRYRNQIRLRFTDRDDFKGVNVSYPSRPGTPPLSSTQLNINPESEEFQLVDLSRRFLILDSYWTLPRQFLGNKVDSYGGSLKYKVRYTLARGETDPEEKPDVVLVGNGQRLIYRRGNPTPAGVVNQKEVKFTEENWQHSSGRPVSREDLMMTLVNLESINIRTIYDNRMVSVALSDIVMDTTTVEYSLQGPAQNVEECRCPAGYSGLSCESCSGGFDRVSGGSFLGTCAGCNCNGHASDCDPISGHCLSCQHNTEGAQCDKCRPGYFGDPRRGRPDDCKSCPCPYTETSRRFSNTCFLDHDKQATCDACRPGYTGRRCERCASGYQGNPLQPNGKCVPSPSSRCDNRGTVSSSSRPCTCKPNVVGALCDECKTGSFHLAEANPDGCLQCFCMGVTKQCASSSWSRDQVRGGVNGQLFTLSNGANTRTITQGILQKSSSEVAFRSFSDNPSDIYYWVLPESFRGDKVTAYGGELRYTVRYEPGYRSLVNDGQPDVVLQGNGIFLEHYSKTKPLPRVPTTITVLFREGMWRRADGQPCTREHLLMALADTAVFMIRATYADNMVESSLSDIRMDIAVPHSTGNERALEVEECACPRGYRGPSCQECDVGYSRIGSGLYLGTCERCDCHGHASSCDSDTGECLQCQHNTAGPRCDRCAHGYYGDPKTGGPAACQPCPCPGTSPSNQYSQTCYLASDGQPTCDSCPPGYTGRRCERCAAGYTGNPQFGQACTIGNNELNGNCDNCDRRGTERCGSGGYCHCKAHVEGPACRSCRPGHFHLSADLDDGCLACFCMGVTQQCTSSNYYRDTVYSVFSPGNFQDMALVNRQRTNRITTGFTVEVSTDGTQLSFSNFGNLDQEAHYWQLPDAFRGDKVGSYGGTLKYTVAYVAGHRGTPIEDADVQLIGNDITLVSRQTWHRSQGTRESRQFEVVFKEKNWRRPDGMPATREHLMMVLADLDDVLIRASYYTDMLSASISDIRMEVAVPNYSGLAQALEVEQCRCPPGYQGLSCQDCAPGYSRTGGGLYLGHCELCECNGHSDSCHPETGVCTNCLHNTMGGLCEQCASGYFGDPTAGTPEDCQPCACPHMDPDYQFSPTCESTGNGGYQCTACLPGYTGQTCERCAEGYEGDPQRKVRCRPKNNAASLVVKVHPERVLVSQGTPVTLRCQVTGSPPHYFYWSREDRQPVSSHADRRRQGEELYFPSIEPSDAGVYICTCRDLRSTNTSRAEIVVTTVSKPIEVTVEEPKAQSVTVGSAVSFICTAKSKSPAYTLVWTRQGNRKLPHRAMDFNGILTIQNVQPEDAGVYVCTGSNMFAMDEGTAVLYVPEASQTQMFYTAYEMFEGHRAPSEGSQAVATVHPPVLTVQRGQRAEFRCTTTGNPAPAIEWIGGQGNQIPRNAIIRGGVLTIPEVERSDEGEYICKALNTHGEHTARAVLYVHSASLPHVQVSPQRVEIHEGETLRLYCRAGGTPSPGLTWKKKGGQLPPQARMERTDIGTLLIPNIRMADAGTYLCVGTNNIGFSEAPIEVSVGRGEPISTVSIRPSIATVQEGQSLDLSCVVPGSPPLSVTWIRVGRHLSSNHQVLGTQLRILRASPDDSGEYICRVEGEPRARQGSVTVSVTPSSSGPISTGSNRPSSATVQEGQSLDLSCVVPGSPPLSVTWIRVGRHLSSNHQVVGTQLRILRASPDDSGEYICRVEGEPRVRQGSVTVSVTPSSSGPISTGSIHPSVATVQEGQSLDLNCVVPGSPPLSVTWIRVGGHLPSNHQVVGTQLRILRASPDDSGEYICRVEGEPRVRQGSVTVSVTPSSSGPISAGSIHPSIATVQEGQSLDLSCVVPGSPPLSVTWIRVGRHLSSNHQVVGTQLRILQASPDDSGEYICRVEGEPRVRQGSVTVSVTPSSSGPIHPSTATVQEGQPLDLNCVVPGSPPISVTWIRVGGHLSSNHQVLGTQLRILQASQDDSGEYICRVEDGPPVRQGSVTVSVTASSSRQPTPIISIDPHSATVRLGESASFRCRVHAGAQPVRLEWKLPNNQPLPDNVKVSRDGTEMTVTNAQSSNQGTYRCVASNVFGITQSIISLRVRESPKAVVTPQGVVRVRVGEPINLECQGSGEPRPVVNWHRVDSGRRTVLTSPVPMDSNAVLQVLAARPEDSGTYSCTVQNSEGTTEVRVEVRVEGGEQVATAPRASVAEPLLVVEEGKTATLRCQAHGVPTPTITWSKLRSPLPWRHRVANNSLILPGVGRQDSGQYICNATNSLGTSEVTVMLDVETPPYATTLPDDLAVRVGEVIRLQCLSHGTPPLRFEWTKEGDALPARAEVDNGNLQINLATAADAGTYKCVVSNRVGSSEAVAKVAVRSPLAVRVWPEVEVKAVGSAVEFTCSAAGGVHTAIEWLKEGGPMPVNHHIKDGVLRIENLERSNEGIYICRATGVYGQAQDTAKLTIQALPKVMINVRTSVQTVMIGNSVEFECQAIGDPQPSVRWSKVGGELPAHVVVRGGMLKIEQVTEADAGQYRCTATNNVGSVQSEVVLNIQSLPQIVAPPDVKEVNLGSAAVFPCLATGYPAPEIKWSKLDGELGPTATQEGNVLTIPSVKQEDGGTYVCTASNKQGMVQAFTTLKIHERVMPHFTQTPLSYLTLPTIKNSYKAFTMKINFRPDSADGMIIYNGQKRTAGADFVSLGLVGGRPEFRFDVGSGMATIRYPTPIKLGEFHTVELHRNLTMGSIVVDGDAPINGSSQGKFQGLDLNEELFVGGYPNYTVIAKTTGLKTGFVGCIRQLIIQGEEVIFKDLDRSSTGVSNCPSCKDYPCQNGGVCQDSETSIYKCSCARGYTGSNCEHQSSLHCHPEACGADATCINRPSGLGYDCRCHLGKSGDKCMQGTLVTTPHFDGEYSFIAYPPLTNIHNDLRVEMEFKPLDQDGLMFFSWGKKMKVEDFVALSMVDGHVEFRYELGTGMAVLRSREPVTLGQWHHVVAERLNKDGFLKVDEAREVSRSSPGKAQGLNIHTPMYLGGVPNMDILPKPANVTMLFEGCVGEVSVNGKKVDLSYSFTESRAISQCVDTSPCDHRPCLNGGSCMSSAEYEYQCLCQDGFEGDRCEVVKEACQADSQCQNGGRCANGQCVCPSGYSGLHCEDDAPAQHAAYFHDDGYLVLPKPVFPRSSADAPETIELEIRTTTSEGLILWQGVELGEEGKGKDFISLGLQSGRLVFSYQLGSGEAEIISEEPINDGKWHQITAVRTGKQGYVQIDGGVISRGQSQGRSIMVNTKGNVFLGGAPDMTALTGGKFSSGITGCVRNLALMNARPGEQQAPPIDLQAHTQEGFNVERCPS